MAGCGAAARTGTLVGTLGVYGGAETARSCGCFMEEALCDCRTPIEHHSW